MHLFEGRVYNDDRLFILDLSPAKKGHSNVWAVTTRRNCDGFPPIRVDDFLSEEEAIAFIKRVEPTTPRISIGCCSPVPTPTYEEHCRQLHVEGVPSALQIRDLNRNTSREIMIEENLVIAIGRRERRLWLYDGESGMNILIPMTNFYNELMLHKNIRDPNIALVSHNFFTHLDKYSDDDLRGAFIAYNNLKRKVERKIEPFSSNKNPTRHILTKWMRKVR